MIKLRTIGLVFLISLLSSIVLEFIQGGSGALHSIMNLNFGTMRLIMVYTFIYSAIVLVFIGLFRLLSKIL